MIVKGASNHKNDLQYRTTVKRESDLLIRNHNYNKIGGKK